MAAAKRERTGPPPGGARRVGVRRWTIVLGAVLIAVVAMLLASRSVVDGRSGDETTDVAPAATVRVPVA